MRIPDCRWHPSEAFRRLPHPVYEFRVALAAGSAAHLLDRHFNSVHGRSTLDDTHGFVVHKLIDGTGGSPCLKF